MIPNFPEFKILEFSDKEEFDSITSQFPPYSDFNFISCYYWDINNTTLISKLNGNVVLIQSDCITGDKYFSFLGIHKVPETLNELRTYIYKNKMPFVLKWISEETISYLEGIDLKIREDLDYFDYIYNISELHNATDSKYKRYRKDLARFNKKYPYLYSKQIDITDYSIKREIRMLYQNWMNSNNNNLNEFKAFEKLLTIAHKFKDIFAIAIFDKDKIVAFSIDSFYNKDYGCGFFWKANKNYIGIYQFLMSQIVNAYHINGIKHMNNECDLGIDTLRISKLYYRPAFFLKKYTIDL